MDWNQIKLWLSAISGLDMDALHVHAGILFQIGAALLLRKRLSSPWPWLLLLAVLIANETYDYNYEVWPQRAMQRAEAWKDIWNTLLLPTVVLLLARYLPSLFVKPLPSDPATPEVSAADPGQSRPE